MLTSGRALGGGGRGRPPCRLAAGLKARGGGPPREGGRFTKTRLGLEKRPGQTALAGLGRAGARAGPTRSVSQARGATGGPSNTRGPVVVSCHGRRARQQGGGRGGSTRKSFSESFLGPKPAAMGGLGKRGRPTRPTPGEPPPFSPEHVASAGRAGGRGAGPQGVGSTLGRGPARAERKNPTREADFGPRGPGRRTSRLMISGQRGRGDAKGARTRARNRAPGARPPACGPARTRGRPGGLEKRAVNGFRGGRAAQPRGG